MAERAVKVAAVEAMVARVEAREAESAGLIAPTASRVASSSKKR